MKQRNSRRPPRPTHRSLALALATALMSGLVAAAEPAADAAGPEALSPRLSEEQARAVEQARARQGANPYTEREEAAIDLAVQTVSERVPVSRESLGNLRVRSIDWPDSSLGCAEPGVEYTQQVVPGHLVSFTVDDRIYSVHVGERTAVICDRITDYLAERRQRGTSIIQAYQAAREDLAGKLYVDPEQVTVTNVQTLTWPDASLGCPVEGQEYEKGPVEGLRITMTCRDRQYEYRTALGSGVFVSCEEIVSCHETQ
jgi:hypothetical protein